MFNFAFFVENATFNDINQFVNAVSTTRENQNLQLLWRHVVREGRDLGYEKGRNEGYEEGYEAGYEMGYQDCEDKYRDPREDWKELEQSLGVNLKSKNKPKPTTADAASQTKPQFGQNKDVNTLADPLPPGPRIAIPSHCRHITKPVADRKCSRNLCHRVLIVVACRPPGKLSTDNAYY